MLNCVIIDDHIEAIEVIEDHLKRFPEITVSKIFTDSIEALHFLERNKVDLIFLDIEMPNLNGLEFIETLRLTYGKNIPKFIYTTGYHKYAISGFDQGASDYLLKPITFKRFKLSIERYMDALKEPSQFDFSANKDFFYIESEGVRFKVLFKNIVYIEGGKNNTHIIEKGVERKVYKPMHYIENLLSSNNTFIRVHKSFIISENYVDSIKVNDIIMVYGNQRKTIPIGRTYKEIVLKKLK